MTLYQRDPDPVGGDIPKGAVLAMVGDGTPLMLVPAKHRTYYQLCVDRGWTLQRYAMTNEEKAYQRLSCYREAGNDAWLEVRRITEWEKIEA